MGVFLEASWSPSRLGCLRFFSTRDCRCPISTIGVRENGENRVLFSAVSPRAYKRKSGQCNQGHSLEAA